MEKTDSESWSKILGAVGIAESTRPQASIVIAGESANGDVAKLADDHILVLIGNGAATAKFGIQSTTDALRIRQIWDMHAPAMQIIWERPVGHSHHASAHGFSGVRHREMEEQPGACG